MDGKGCWRDNVIIERLWRTIKYEHVYLHAYESVAHARTLLTGYLNFYYQARPHAALDGRAPDDMYFDARPVLAFSGLAYFALRWIRKHAAT